MPIGPVILIDTLLQALFTILGIGSVLNPILERLGVKRKESDARDGLDDVDAEGAQPKNCSAKIKQKIRNFDNEYFSPLFIK